MSMPLEVGAFEAKTQLSRLLELAQKGERITITKHGVPVAQLVPAGRSASRDLDGIITELKAIRRRTRKGKESIKALIREGQRF
jgi:prevent-host-death family protein